MVRKKSTPRRGYVSRPRGLDGRYGTGVDQDAGESEGQGQNSGETQGQGHGEGNPLAEELVAAVEEVEAPAAEIDRSGDTALVNPIAARCVGLRLTKVNSPRKRPPVPNQRTREVAVPLVAAPPQRPVHGREYAEVEEVVPTVVGPPQQRVHGEDAGRENNDVELVGVVNTLRLPHNREYCTEFPFVPENRANNRQTCSFCFCYICQLPVEECRVWLEHCCAQYHRR
jgi:hypothetical protein